MKGKEVGVVFLIKYNSLGLIEITYNLTDTAAHIRRQQDTF